MEEKIECKICDRIFGSKESLEMHNKAKHPEKISKERKSLPIKKIRNWSIFILVLGLVVLLIILGFSGIERLPPTDIQGHIEDSPGSHVLKEPMPLAVQKHMLEHVDGIEGGRGGVIINYNCNEYECEEGLVEKLELFALEFDYVYVAPFKKMDAKIALTKFGKIEVLNEYDGEVIRNFIM